MWKYRYLFFVLILSIGISTSAFAQKNGPPPPNEKNHIGGPPCNPGNGNGNGNGGNNGGGNGGGNSPGIPPPVGLCLPIDDYVYLLMAVGVMYGCYKFRKIENT